MIRNIKLFGYAVIFNFFLRIVMYIICGAVMHGFVPNYMNITQQELNSKNVSKNRYHMQRPLPWSTVCYPGHFRRSYKSIRVVFGQKRLFLCQKMVKFRNIKISTNQAQPNVGLLNGPLHNLQKYLLQCLFFHFYWCKRRCFNFRQSSF